MLRGWPLTVHAHEASAAARSEHRPHPMAPASASAYAQQHRQHSEHPLAPTSASAIAQQHSVLPVSFARAALSADQPALRSEHLAHHEAAAPNAGRPTEHVLSPEQLRASLQVAPALARSCGLWQRLERGNGVKLALFGASVAIEGGCERQLQPERRCVEFDGSPGVKQWAFGRTFKTQGVRGFGLAALDWLDAAFPPKNGSKHQLLNFAVDATPAQALEDCPLGEVPDDVDAVLLELTSQASLVSAIERIMRRLLRYRRQPLLLMLNVRSWCSCEGGTELEPDGLYQCPTGYTLSREWRGREDAVAELCVHYGQACISMRNAIFKEVMRNSTGFSIREVASDCLHPSRSVRGHLMLSEMVMHALKAALGACEQAAHRGTGTASSPTALGGGVAAQLPLPLWAEVDARKAEANGMLRCYFPQPVGLTNRKMFYSQPAYFTPEPVLPDGSFLVDTGHGLVSMPEWNQTAARAQSFACTALWECVSGTPAGAAREACVRPIGHWQRCWKALSPKRPAKLGVLAFTPGAVMELRLNVAPPVARAMSEPALVTLTYLTSYEQMGIARVSCVRSCSCEEQRIDANNWMRSEWGRERNVSVANTTSFRVRPSPEASEQHLCALRFVVDSESSSLDGGHKFKLLHVSVKLHWADQDGQAQYSGNT